MTGRKHRYGLRSLKRARLESWAISAMVLMGLAACDGGYSAPYTYGSGKGYPKWTLADEIVTTELHSYDKNKADEDRFRVFGHPYKFRFPAKYYGYSTNFQGGSQYYVRLLLDGPSLRSAVDVIREHYGVSTIEEVGVIAMGGGAVPNYKPREYDDLMEITIDKRDVFSDEDGKVEFQVPDVAQALTQELKKEILSGDRVYSGEYCGFDIYKKTKVNHTVQRGNSFRALNNRKGSKVLSAGCDDKPDTCQVLVSYRGFGLDIRIRRKNLCVFRESYERLPSLLDQHSFSPRPIELANITDLK